MQLSDVWLSRGLYAFFHQEIVQNPCNVSKRAIAKYNAFWGSSSFFVYHVDKPRQLLEHIFPFALDDRDPEIFPVWTYIKFPRPF